MSNVPGSIVGKSTNGIRSFEIEGFSSALDLDSPIRMEKTNSFDLASLTKIVATTASFILLSDSWNLDDEIRKFLPLWKGSDKSSITIRNLLQHTGGLPPWLPLYTHTQDASAAHDLIATLPLMSRPGSLRVYSDFGFMTLGKVLQAISGKNLQDTFNEIVAQPFGLHETSFAIPKTIPASTSRGDRFELQMLKTKQPYAIKENVEDFDKWRTHILTGEINDGNSFHVFNGISGHAGLFSTVEDLLTFCEKITLTPLFESFVEDSFVENFHLGFKSWDDSFGSCRSRFYGHTGFTGTALAVCPSHNSSIVYLSNRLHTDGIPPQTEELIKATIAKFHAELHK